MNTDQHETDLTTLRQRLRDQKRANFCLFAVAMVIGLAHLKEIGNERTVVIPPTIDKTFWVTRDRVSSAYLEQMASYSAYLILDVTANNVDWKRDVVLQYVAPEASGLLRTRQEVEADRLKKINAATFFTVQQFFNDEASMSTVMKGRLVTIVNGSRVDTDGEPKAYIAGFQYSGGRIQLQTFKEVPYDSTGNNNAELLADRSSNRRG